MMMIMISQIIVFQSIYHPITKSRNHKIATAYATANRSAISDLHISDLIAVFVAVGEEVNLGQEVQEKDGAGGDAAINGEDARHQVKEPAIGEKQAEQN